MTFWDRHAKRFDKPAPTPEDDEAVRRAIPWLDQSHRVLEIGCAAGATAEALRPHVRSWHGIDVSAKMVQRAQRRTEAGLTFQQATIDDPSLDDGQWDAIIAFNVLHFMDLPRDLDRASELLRPGGLLIAQTPCLGDLNPLLRAMFPIAAFLIRLKGLHLVRSKDLRDIVTRQFDLVEEDLKRPLRSWIVGERTVPE